MGNCAVPGETRMFWNGASSFTSLKCGCCVKLPLDLKVRASAAAASVVNDHVCRLVGEAWLGCCVTIF